MQNIDHLIHAKHIVTCEENNRELENHSIAIHEGKILAILPTEQAKQKYHAAKEDHYPHHIVMPGFINSHTHLPMNLFRGLADDLELMDWLNNYIWPAETKWVSDELVYDSTLLSIAEMIRGGTTTFNEMYFFPDATARATELAGMRGHIGMTVIGFPTNWARTTEEYFEKSIAFYEQYKNHSLITPTLAPHSTYTVTIKDLERVKRLADDYHLKTNIHLQEAPSEIQYSMENFKKRPLERLHEIGLVTPNLIGIHMTQIDADDIKILENNRMNIVHCPESNMKLVSGQCPVAQLSKLGINVALGTDGAASNNDLDMFGEMRSAAFLGKITANDPRALPADQVLKMATINGAKALGIDHMTGSLVPGKAADFIAIDIEQIETMPLYHSISQIVYATQRSQVTDVWVAGRQLMKNRELQTLDMQDLLAKAQSWGKKIALSLDNAPKLAANR